MPTTYKIPKKRKTIKTIKINNGSLTFDVAKGKGYWFRNGKYITPEQLKTYKFYDKAIKGYRTLDNEPGIAATFKNGIEFEARTPVHTPMLNKLKDLSYVTRVYNAKDDFKANNKFITLRTKGKMNLATIPTNVLDSIAINSGRAGVDIKTGLGLVGKESTFGGWSIPLGYGPKDADYSHSMLTNNHSYFIDKYGDYLSAVTKKYPNMYRDDAEKVKAENDADYAFKHGLIKDRTPHYNDNIMADAFERYSVNPKNYNPGQSNYSSMVTNIGNEVFGYKPIQDWYNTEGVTYYNKGREERRRLESRGNKTK